MKKEIILLSAQKVDFTDDKTGKQVKGASIFYCENMEPFESEEKKGVEILKAFLPIECFDRMPLVPASYNAEYKISTIKNQMVLKMINIDYVGALS